MAYASWFDQSLTASRNGQTVTLTISGTAFEGTGGAGVVSKTWTFYVYKNGSKTSTTVGGFTVNSYRQAVFSNKTFTFTLSGSDLGTNVSFSVVGSCTVVTQNEGTFTATTEDNPSASVSVSSPTLSWSSGASLSATPNSAMKVVLTRNGSVTVGNGYSGTVYYRIWCESTRKNNDGDPGSSWTVDPNSLDTELTYKIQAYSSVWGREFTSSQLTVKATVVSGNYIDYYNGSAWVQCKAYYYNGTAWVECKPYYYNGSAWVECSS